MDFASYVGEHVYGSHAPYTSNTDFASIRFPKRGFVVIVLGMWIQVDNDYGSWDLWTKELTTARTIFDAFGGVESSSVRFYSVNNIIAIEVTQNTDLRIMWKNTVKVSNQKLVWNCLSSAGAPIITYNV